MEKRLRLALWVGMGLIVFGSQPGIAQTDLTTVALASITLDVGVRGTVEGYIVCGVPDECRAFAITIEYDPDVLQVHALNLGPYLGDQGREVVNVIDQDAGTVRLEAEITGAGAPTGELLLFTLDVTGLAPGTTRLDIAALDVTDSAGNPVNAEGVGGTVTVEPAATPAVSLPGVTGITAHSRDIFLDGQAKGNNAHVFENVGDSITYTWAYLRDFITGYDLGEYAYLEPALDFFSGPNGLGESPFWAEPIAAYAGWTSADVLEPGNALTGPCRDDESPLECSYRVNRPAVALILLGTNDAGSGTPVETFEANMRVIIEISINKGVIPVISTIPPMVRRDDTINAYNRAIRILARTNDIPLWDYNAALNALPNRGLSEDGIHPSRAPDKKDAYFDPEHLQYGFNVRNLGALQVLYELWQQVLFDADSAQDILPPHSD